MLKDKVLLKHLDIHAMKDGSSSAYVSCHPPVGKSGPGMSVLSSAFVMSGFFMRAACQQGRIEQVKRPHT
jgi:hypothetical protein